MWNEITLNLFRVVFVADTSSDVFALQILVPIRSMWLKTMKKLDFDQNIPIRQIFYSKSKLLLDVIVTYSAEFQRPNEVAWKKENDFLSCGAQEAY